MCDKTGQRKRFEFRAYLSFLIARRLARNREAGRIRFLNGNFHTTRPVGRPRTRWADVVQRDALRLLGIRGWRRRSENRDEWRHLIREAKVRKGL
jgi:hypothetical protein